MVVVEFLGQRIVRNIIVILFLLGLMTILHLAQWYEIEDVPKHAIKERTQ